MGSLDRPLRGSGGAPGQAYRGTRLDGVPGQTIATPCLCCCPEAVPLGDLSVGRHSSSGVQPLLCTTDVRRRDMLMSWADPVAFWWAPWTGPLSVLLNGVPGQTIERLRGGGPWTGPIEMLVWMGSLDRPLLPPACAIARRRFHWVTLSVGRRPSSCVQPPLCTPDVRRRDMLTLKYCGPARRPLL
jgi:hypothetical protein